MQKPRYFSPRLDFEELEIPAQAAEETTSTRVVNLERFMGLIKLDTVSNESE